MVCCLVAPFTSLTFILFLSQTLESKLYPLRKLYPPLPPITPRVSSIIPVSLPSLQHLLKLSCIIPVSFSLSPLPSATPQECSAFFLYPSHILESFKSILHHSCIFLTACSSLAKASSSYPSQSLITGRGEGHRERRKKKW